jgi:hypothetical protein
MIEKLSKNVQKEVRFRIVAFLGSESGSEPLKIVISKYHQGGASTRRYSTLYSTSTMSAACESGPSLTDKLTEARISSSDDIKALISQLELLPKLPTKFLDSLDDLDRVLCFRSTLLCYYAMNGAQIPHEMQLQAVLVDQHGKDYLVAAGTGSGKTLPMAINILLDDPSKHLITITISPLKRLQSTQENDFNTRYGIPTVVINEDTPRDDTWWNASPAHCTSLKLSLSHVRLIE